MLVNVGEEFGRHSLPCKRLNSPSGSIGGRICDADDGNGDDSVEDGWQTVDSSELDGIHERRGLGVGA